MENNGGARRRGQGAMNVGLLLLVVGFIGLLVSNFASGLAVLICVAGLVTFIVGIGIRREKPAA